MTSYDGDDRLEIKTGGGFLMLFGLPFLIAGLAVIVDSQTVAAKNPGAHQSPLFAFLFGAVFAGVGAVIMFGRAGTIIDRRVGTITTWWGLLVPMCSKTRPLNEFSKVTLGREVRRSNKRTRVVYPVRLVSAGSANLNLEEPQNVEKARQKAERIAKFVGLPLVDTSHGSPIVRQAHELDESLRERARRTGVRPEVPKTPPGVRSSYRIEGETLVMEIPPGGLSRMLSFPLVVAGAAPLIAGLMFFNGIRLGDMNGQMMSFLLVASGAIVGIPLLTIVAPTLHRAWQRTTLELTSHTLTVTSRSPLYRSTTRIPADELEELEIIFGGDMGRGWGRPGHSILARSDHASVQFGEGLPMEELRWVRDVVHSVVTS